MIFEQALEHYRKGCNIRVPLDVIIDGWLQFRSGDEISVLPIHINSNRWEAYGLQGWTPTPIFTPGDYNPGPTKYATTSLVYSIEEIVDTHTTEIFALEGRVNKLEDKIKIQNMAKEMLERIRILEEGNK